MVEGKDITSHRLNNEISLLQFQCLLVKVMAEILPHHYWVKPMKHKVQWVTTHSGSDGNAHVPPLVGKWVYTVWCNTMQHCGLCTIFCCRAPEMGLEALWGFLMTHSRCNSCFSCHCSWTNYALSEGMNIFRPTHACSNTSTWKGKLHLSEPC